MRERSFLIALVVASILSPVVRSLLLRHDILDQPNERSSHTTPTPRGGGVAVAFACAIALIGTLNVSALVAVVASSLGLGVIGFIDDRRSVQPLVRLAAQLLIPLCATPILLRGMPTTDIWTWIFGLGVVMWSATYVNAFNFMDGVNGMAVAQTVVAGFGFAVMGARWSSPVLTLLGLIIAGSIMGFAPYNVPTARLFLGDVGSYFIGAWLALTAVVALRENVPAEVVFAPFVLYLCDTGLTLLRRRKRGVSLFSAHREHAYQKLVQAGWSHTYVAIVAFGVMTASTGLSIWASKSGIFIRSVAVIAVLVLAAVFVLLPDLVGHQAKRRHRST